MMTLTDPVSDADLRKAIEILISESFLAMSFANAIGGSDGGIVDAPWRLLRTFTPLQLFDEAMERKLPLGEFRSAVGGRPITEAPIYQAYLRSKEQPDCGKFGSTRLAIQSHGDLKTAVFSDMSQQESKK